MRRKKRAWSSAVISDPPQTGCARKVQHARPPAERRERGQPDPRVHGVGGAVVGAADHRVEQRALVAAQLAVADVGAAQVGDEQHRLDHAGAPVLHRSAVGPVAVARADGERDLALRVAAKAPRIAQLRVPAARLVGRRDRGVQPGQGDGEQEGGGDAAHRPAG